MGRERFEGGVRLNQQQNDYGQNRNRNNQPHKNGQQSLIFFTFSGKKNPKIIKKIPKRHKEALVEHICREAAAQLCLDASPTEQSHLVNDAPHQKEKVKHLNVRVGKKGKIKSGQGGKDKTKDTSFGKLARTLQINKTEGCKQSIK